MLYVGKVVMTLLCINANEHPGEYVFVKNLMVYLSTLVGDHFRWVEIVLPQFNEKTFFYDRECNVLYELLPDSTWIKSRYTGFTDDGSYLYYFKRGRFITRKRLVTVFSTNYVSLNLSDVSAVIPLDTEYRRIIIPNQSNAGISATTNPDPNLGEVYLGSILGITVIYYYYLDWVKYQVTTIILRSAISFPTVNFTSASIKSNNFFISNGYLDIAQGDQTTITSDPTGINVWVPYTNLDGYTFPTATFVYPDSPWQHLYGQLIINNAKYTGSATGGTKNFEVNTYLSGVPQPYRQGVISVDKTNPKNITLNFPIGFNLTPGQRLQVQIFARGLNLLYTYIQISWSIKPF